MPQRPVLQPDYLLVDLGTPINLPVLLPHQCVGQGDSRCVSIAAASILAKVYRDELMTALHTSYPELWLGSEKTWDTRPASIHDAAGLSRHYTPATEGRSSCGHHGNYPDKDRIERLVPEPPIKSAVTLISKVSTSFISPNPVFGSRLVHMELKGLVHNPARYHQIRQTSSFPVA